MEVMSASNTKSSAGTRIDASDGSGEGPEATWAFTSLALLCGGHLPETHNTRRKAMKDAISITHHFYPDSD